jgi:hypothetical protein
VAQSSTALRRVNFRNPQYPFMKLTCAASFA